MACRTLSKQEHTKHFQGRSADIYLFSVMSIVDRPWRRYSCSAGKFNRLQKLRYLAAVALPVARLRTKPQLARLWGFSVMLVVHSFTEL
jgi:hypothetical protein